MSKKDFIDQFATQINTTKVQATTIFDEFMKLIIAQIESTDGDGFRLPELGTFYKKKKPARKGKNPRTGEPINIPEQYAVSFKPSKTLKDKVNS